ncbi:hypothetical protein DPMN_166662 [Dreissena polymorpha]|uniref:Uncharacterized protein n=1 Tax=Dreissena polymorpha TaxID=45954 RepID=A0A9D4EYD2_DREPO|nr:hypothetical protein DPMN_166662 [Dreissena polymorpha]
MRETFPDGREFARTKGQHGPNKGTVRLPTRGPGRGSPDWDTSRDDRTVRTCLQLHDGP